MLRAVILDMDGVIVDSEHQWKLAAEKTFRELFPGWTAKHDEQVVGLGVVDLYHWLVREFGFKEDKETFLKRCGELAKTVYLEKVTCTPGLVDFLRQCRSEGLKLGLASSSPRAWIDMVLGRFLLEEHFSAVVCADDVPQGKTKPEPDIYVECLRRLRVSATEAFAVEDSLLGVTAAKAAKLPCAAFRNGHNDGQDLSAADFEFEAFAG